MDSAWMREKLNEYLQLAERYDAELSDAAYQSVSSKAQRLNDEATTLLPTVGRILTALDAMPGADLRPPSYRGSNETPRWVRQGLGILRDREEWATRLAPRAPVLTADHLHPLIWEAAASLWDADQRVAAVESAAKWLTVEIQQKAQSTLVDRKLVEDVFSPKPSNGKTRLWLPGKRETEMWRSRQEGLHHLSIGAYAGIRNVAAHSPQPGWSDQQALEYLAVLSTVTRWTDETEVLNP